MKFKLTPYNLQELGQRQNQEDSLFPGIGHQTANDRLFILCDGMGGHEKGEVASATVCETMSNCILSRWNPNEPLSDGLLQQAIEEAYDALDAKDNGEEKKMGTTMTFICFHADGVTVAHIGDSRVYQLRPATKKEAARIVFKTRDHSLVNDLIDIGEITEEEAKNYPQKNVITRAMQPCQERRAKASIAHLTDIQEGDYFYMCSDGMLEQSTDDNILNIITKKDAKNEQKVEMLRNVTDDNKDNHTAHLIYINKVEGKALVAVAPKPFMSQGVWVTPQQEKQKKPKNKKMIVLIAAVVTLLITIVAGVLFFMNPFADEQNTEDQKEDSVKTEINEPQHKVEQAAPSQVEEEKEQEIPEQESTESEEQQPVHSDESAAPTEQSSSQPKPEPQGKTNDIVSKFTKGKGKAPEQGKPQTINLTNRNNK